MNKNQLILNIAILALFLISMCLAPFDVQTRDTAGARSQTKTIYRPVFAPPNMNELKSRKISPSLAYTWIGLGGLYFGVFQLLKVLDKPQRRPNRPRPQGQRPPSDRPQNPRRQNYPSRKPATKQ